jgi:hypothetical protein
MWSTNINLVPPLGQSKKFIILSFISCYVEYWEGLGAGIGVGREIYNKFS